MTGRIAGVTAGQTRERLLEAAAGVFAERGYDGTRVADIASAAGVSNGALYAHFASKAELLVEALVAARRDDDVARLMRGYVAERAEWLAGLVGAAQAGGELDGVLPPGALAHFCLLLAMGSALVTPGLHAVDEEEWAALLARVASASSPGGITAQTGAAQ